MNKPFFLTVLIVSTAVGCASRERSVAAGVTLGATAGGIHGAALYPINTKKGITLGAFMGGITGGIIGWMIKKGLEKRDEKIRREMLFNFQRHGITNPSLEKSIRPGLSKPSVDVDFVEPRIEGENYIEGHRVWKISEESQWVFPDQIQKKENKNEK